METPSAQVIDHLWGKVPEILPYHSQYIDQGLVCQPHQSSRRSQHPDTISVICQWENLLHLMVQSAERVDTNTIGFLLSNESVHETNSQYLLVGIVFMIIIILWKWPQIYQAWDHEGQPHYAIETPPPNFCVFRIDPKQSSIGPRLRTRWKRL